jgi:hypothetical protein
MHNIRDGDLAKMYILFEGEKMKQYIYSDLAFERYDLVEKIRFVQRNIGLEETVSFLWLRCMSE